MSSRDFDSLVEEATAAPREGWGWNFSFLDGRTTGGDLPWSYAELARPLLDTSSRLLDQDTGGGEVLADLAPLPAHVVATEGWEPNVGVARRRLEPLGVEVRRSFGTTIPAGDGDFDLVLNRHGANLHHGLDPAELARVLCPGGHFLTQQVQANNNHEFEEALGMPTHHPDDTDGDELAEALKLQGFQVTKVEQVAVPVTYLDIGAVVFQLLMVSQIPGFTTERFDAELRRLDRRIRAEGGFTVYNHRYLVAAVKP